MHPIKGPKLLQGRGSDAQAPNKTREGATLSDKLTYDIGYSWFLGEWELFCVETKESLGLYQTALEAEEAMEALEKEQEDGEHPGDTQN